MANRDDNEPGDNVNHGYAAFQLAKALATGETHHDPETRQRAEVKASNWLKVIRGIFDGTLNVGSRAPIRDTPVWATPKVVTGGFATGELLASGPLQKHELEMLEKLSRPAEVGERSALNAYFLTDEGLAALQEQLQTGRYDIGVPEEGALLMVAWLAGQGRAELARNLLDEIGPYFSRLRFYPRPASRPPCVGTNVYLQDVGTTMRHLDKIKAPPMILAQKETIDVWLPMYHRMVALFLETVDGDPPRLTMRNNNQPLPRVNGKYDIQGGWPCQHYPNDWFDRARQMLEEEVLLRAERTLCGKPQRAKGSYVRLRERLQRCVAGSESLTGRDVGIIRLVLARYVTKRGLPQSAKWNALEHAQKRQVEAPTHEQLAQLVTQRMAGFRDNEGIADIEAVLQPITPSEAKQLPIPLSTPVPQKIRRKVRRSLAAPVTTLVSEGIITSADTLATLLPQITSRLLAASIADAHLRQLYSTLYRSFRQRRSLLLLNLSSQIKFEELPWIAAADDFRTADQSAAESSKQAFAEMAKLTLMSFPHAIVPNKMLQELRSLAKEATFTLPLVDEIAADIFAHAFSEKFLRAAQSAATLLKGTLYETYYGIDYTYVSKIDDIEKIRNRSPVSNEFYSLCVSRVGGDISQRGVAQNGMIIEQEQILTTQNLAVLFESIGLQQVSTPELLDMTHRCFAWVCHQLGMTMPDHHSQLVSIKNAAYAWRQMVFFLSFVPRSETENFLQWAKAHIADEEATVRARLSSLLRGLEFASHGQPSNGRTWPQNPEVRCFLGWTTKNHWLQDDDQPGVNETVCP